MSDFSAVRYELEPRELAISEGQDVEPTDLIHEETWVGVQLLARLIALPTPKMTTCVEHRSK